MEYSVYPTNTFQTLVIGAGVLLTDFDPSEGTVNKAKILGPTTGGVNFKATPSYIDFGEDIDNVPKNTKELKRIEDWEVTMSGTLIAVTPDAARYLAAAADLTAASGKITPRDTLDLTEETGDFRDIWLVADYSDINTSAGNATAGFVAIKMMNALSTGGFSLQTGDKEKGQFEVEFTGHVSIDAQEVVPMEFYIKAGTDESAVYEYVEATLTDGFKYGVTYYTRTGAGTDESPYVYTEVTSGAEYSDQTTYYIKQLAA